MCRCVCLCCEANLHKPKWEDRPEMRGKIYENDTNDWKDFLFFFFYFFFNFRSAHTKATEWSQISNMALTEYEYILISCLCKYCGWFLFDSRKSKIKNEFFFLNLFYSLTVQFHRKTSNNTLHLYFYFNLIISFSVSPICYLRYR